MKKIMSIAVSIIIAFSCLGMAYADEERSINQLLNDYQAAYDEKDISAFKKTIYKVSFSIWSSKNSGIGSDSPIFKGFERYFSIYKSYKITDRQIKVLKNIAYVQCKEIQTIKNGKTEIIESMITLVKERGRWYIAIISGQEVQ